MWLSELDAEGLAWLAAQPDGASIYMNIPAQFQGATRRWRNSLWVSERKMLAGFLGIRLTKAGRAALAAHKSGGEK